MERLAIFGRLLFGLALIGLGVEHILFREFVAARAPAWPEGVAGGTAWAIATGAFLTSAGTAIALGVRVRESAYAFAVLVAAYALVRQFGPLAASPVFGVQWTLTGKAVAFTGGAIAIAERRAWFLVVGRAALGAFLVVSGIQHFKFAAFVATLIPGWIPGAASFWTHAAGIALIAFGAGMQVPRLARWSAALAGAMIFSWFWVVHLPRTLLSRSDAIALFEALAFAGLAFLIAGATKRAAS